MVKRILLLLTVALIGISGCAGVRARQERIERIHESLTKAVNYILSKQDEDGSWKSETYGCFREGTALTPFIMSGLLFLPQGGKDVEVSFNKGAEFMVNMIDEDGNIQTSKYGMNFPVYTAASASRVVVLADKSPRNLQAQAVWRDYLLKLQFSESNGWTIDDPEYGGWGFFPQVPTKPASGVQRHILLQANLSTTTFSIGALRSAKVPMDDPVWEKALLFVRRCQNFPQNPDGADSRYDDGGFYFCPHDPLQNKAGVAGTDKHGVERYNSYGSMTGDGVRALLQCGFEPDHPRLVAARKWLELNFNAKIHPGAFPEDREVLRQATYYYYVWSIAHAFTRLGVAQIESPEGNNKWAEVLADELISQQRPDGSWVNRYTDAKEDDPLVATPWAAAALANCLHVITHPDDLTGNGCPKLLSEKK